MTSWIYTQKSRTSRRHSCTHLFLQVLSGLTCHCSMYLACYPQGPCSNSKFRKDLTPTHLYNIDLYVYYTHTQTHIHVYKTHHVLNNVNTRALSIIHIIYSCCLSSKVAQKCTPKSEIGIIIRPHASPSICILSFAFCILYLYFAGK